MLSGQTVIQIGQDTKSIEMNDDILSGAFYKRSNMTPDAVALAFRNGQFGDSDSILNMSKFKIGLFDIWLALILENKTSEAIPILIKSQHEARRVFKIRGDYLDTIRTLGHAARYDAYHLLHIKERNGFTYLTRADSKDTFLVHLDILEAGESKRVFLYNLNHYNIDQLSSLQGPTLFNGIFLGILLLFLGCTFYLYLRIREVYLFWYICYLLIFIFYYWRDLEFWNTQFDVTHSYLSWFTTQVPITLFIFLFYLLFMNSILSSSPVVQFKIFIKWLLILIPILLILDTVLLYYYPYGSTVLAYTSGLTMGIIQFTLLKPIWQKGRNIRTTNYLLIGSLFLFGGWLSILFFPEEIHQYVVRIFTLFELGFFMIAITERFVKIKNDIIESKLQQELIINQERQWISSDLNQELGTVLSGIKMYAHIAEQHIQTNTVHAAQIALKKIQQSCSELIAQVKEILWLINPGNDTLNKLILRIESIIQNQKVTHKGNLYIDCPVELSSKIISIVKRKNICLLCKSAMEEIFKSEVERDPTVRITCNLNQLVIQIGPDVDFHPFQKGSKEVGFDEMYDLAEEIQAVVKMNRLQDKLSGFIIECSIN